MSSDRPVVRTHEVGVAASIPHSQRRSRVIVAESGLSNFDWNPVPIHLGRVHVPQGFETLSMVVDAEAVEQGFSLR